MTGHMAQKTLPFNLPWHIKEVAGLMEIVKKKERNIKKMIILQLTSHGSNGWGTSSLMHAAVTLFVQIRGASHFSYDIIFLPCVIQE